MSFYLNMAIDTQLKHAGTFLQTSLHQKLSSPNNSGWVLYIARHFTGVADALLTLAIRVGLIAENLIKGIGNILGSLVFRDGSFMTGISQVIIGTGKNICMLPFTCVSAIFKFAKGSPLLFVVTLIILIKAGMSMALRRTAERLANARQQAAAPLQPIPFQQTAQPQQAAPPQTTEQEEAAKTALFHAACVATANTHPTSQAWMTLAEHYREGIGTPKAPEDAIRCTYEAARLNHPEANFFMGMYSCENSSLESAKSFFTTAANWGHSLANIKYAELELEHPSNPALYTTYRPEQETTYSSGFYHVNAFGLYSILATQGENLGAKVVLAFMYAEGKLTPRDPLKAQELLTEVARHRPSPSSPTCQIEQALQSRSALLLQLVFNAPAQPGEPHMSALQNVTNCIPPIAIALNVAQTDPERAETLKATSSYSRAFSEFIDYRYVKTLYTR